MEHVDLKTHLSFVFYKTYSRTANLTNAVQNSNKKESLVTFYNRTHLHNDGGTEDNVPATETTRFYTLNTPEAAHGGKCAEQRCNRSHPLSEVEYLQKFSTARAFCFCFTRLHYSTYTN